MIRDRNIAWLRQRRRLGWNEFNLGLANSTLLTGPGAGDPGLNEISSFGYYGISVGAAADAFTALDIVTPGLWDPKEEIGVRIGWTVEGTPATDDAIVWRVCYDQAEPGDVLTSPKTGTGATLNTAIASQSPSAAEALRYHRTGRGVINANTFNEDSREGIISWGIDVQTLTQFDPNEVQFLYLEIDYMPQLTRNPEDTGEGAITSDLTAA